MLDSGCTLLFPALHGQELLQRVRVGVREGVAHGVLVEILGPTVLARCSDFLIDWLVIVPWNNFVLLQVMLISGLLTHGGLPDRRLDKSLRPFLLPDVRGRLVGGVMVVFALLFPAATAAAPCRPLGFLYCLLALPRS